MTVAGHGTGVRLDPAWWTSGLALHERIDPSAPRSTRALIDHDDPFAVRMADLGLDAERVHALRSEPAESLAARIPRPTWATTTERVLDSARPVEPEELSGSWQRAFARVVAPFTQDALCRIAAGTTAFVEPAHVRLPTVLAGIGTSLAGRLVDIAVRTLVTELHRWRAAGRFTAADERQRFVEFATATAQPDGLAALLALYPVLARLLAQTSDTTASTMVDLLRRLSTDRATIVDTLLDGSDPGPAVGVVTGRGDHHDGGRAVAFVDFADGTRVVHKPRDVATQTCVGAFVDWLAAIQPELSPRAVPTLTMDGYGWSRHIPRQDLTDRAAAERFYRRQGALLALLHVLRATDMHCENVVADGDTPVVVDTETLFNAELCWPDTGDPAMNRLSSSVYRTALLPLMAVGELGVTDVSGIGGGGGPTSPASVVVWVDAGTDRMRLVRRGTPMDVTANRPCVDGTVVDPCDHNLAIIAGFRQTYDTIAARRDEFAALVAGWTELDCRVVTRPTWQYVVLLTETTHPDVLRDAVDRDQALAVLYEGRIGQPLQTQLVTHEIAALWRGDVPMFLARAGSGVLRSPDGTQPAVALPRSGTASALATLAEMSEVDRREQEWIIAATLATRHRARAHLSGAARTRTPTGSAVHPDRLVAAACAVADRIVATAAHGGRDDKRVNWLGIEAVEDRQWLVLPLGASLGGGYLGVAVFLAQLTAVTGIGRYADHARRAVADASVVVDAFAGRPDLVADTGWGGHAGLGGIAYALARLSSLLGDTGLADAVSRMVDVARTAVNDETTADWTSGLAGCLAAMSSVHEELRLDTAAEVAERCADRLHARVADRLWVTGSRSFADGLAGIGWALANHGPHEAHRALGGRLIAAALRGASVGGGWCHGSPGLALAGSCLPRGGPVNATALADVPMRDNLSLCHGELGVAEVLGVLATHDEHRSSAGPVLRQRVGRILEQLRRHGPGCGVPGSVSTPGLLNGLSGIGYGLLRLAAPDRVPSVLLLRPLP